MGKTISILGCGWLGFALAEQLITDGFLVKGSVTSPEKVNVLSDAGIRPYLLELSPEKIEIDDTAFFDADVLIVSIPPRRIPDIETVFPAQIGQLIQQLEKGPIKKVLFISSTSVYAENGAKFQNSNPKSQIPNSKNEKLKGGEIITERDELVPEKPSGKALVTAEQLLTANTKFETTVLRFGGLIGADRNPARFLSRKREVLDGTKPVNLIHRDDCIGIIREIIRQDVWGEVFNACSPGHPTRKEFYELAAQISGLPLPEFTDQPEPYKIVDSTKLIRQLNYQFKYPSPLDYLRQLKV